MSGTCNHFTGKSGAGFLLELWDSFWNLPAIKCPKCGSKASVYYDPFFFAPVRTIKGKRRIKCTSCHFIWRPTRRKQSVWDILKKLI